MLLGGATIMVLMVLAQFDFNPIRLFDEAARQYGDKVLLPGGLVDNPIDALSLGLALMLGTAGYRMFLGFIAAVAFATILSVVAGLTLAGASTISHDIYANVIRKGKSTEKEEVKMAKKATLVLGVLVILLGIAFKGQKVSFMVGLAFAIAASANFPALLMTITWRSFTTQGAVASILTGTVLALILILLGPTVWWVC